VRTRLLVAGLLLLIVAAFAVPAWMRRYPPSPLTMALGIPDREPDKRQCRLIVRRTMLGDIMTGREYCSRPPSRRSLGHNERREVERSLVSRRVHYAKRAWAASDSLDWFGAVDSIRHSFQRLGGKQIVCETPTATHARSEVLENWEFEGFRVRLFAVHDSLVALAPIREPEVWFIDVTASTDQSTRCRHRPPARGGNATPQPSSTPA
jgi:hypothetical protein